MSKPKNQKSCQNSNPYRGRAASSHLFTGGLVGVGLEGQQWLCLILRKPNGLQLQIYEGVWKILQSVAGDVEDVQGHTVAQLGGEFRQLVISQAENAQVCQVPDVRWQSDERIAVDVQVVQSLHPTERVGQLDEEVFCQNELLHVFTPASSLRSDWKYFESDIDGHLHANAFVERVQAVLVEFKYCQLRQSLDPVR